MPFQPDALDADTLRKLAKRLRRAITDHLQVPVATHQSQAILAQAFSFPDWHGALAAVTPETSASQRVAPGQPMHAGANPLLLRPTDEVLTLLSALFHFGDWEHQLDLTTWIPLVQTMTALNWNGPAEAMHLMHLVMEGLAIPGTAIPSRLLTWVREWLTETHTRVAFFNRRRHLAQRTVREELGDILRNLWMDATAKVAKSPQNPTPAAWVSEGAVPFIYAHTPSEPRVNDSSAMFIALLKAIEADSSLLQQGADQALFLALQHELTNPLDRETVESSRQSALMALNTLTPGESRHDHGFPRVNRLFLTLVQQGWMTYMGPGQLMALYLGHHDNDLFHALKTEALGSATQVNQWTAATTWARSSDPSYQMGVLPREQLMALLEGLIQTLDRYLPHTLTPTEHDPGVVQVFWNETLQQTADLFDRLDEMNLFMVCQQWQNLHADELMHHFLTQFRHVDLRLALAFERGSKNLNLSLPFRVLYGLEEARAHLDPARPTVVSQRMAAASAVFSGDIFSTRKAAAPASKDPLASGEGQALHRALMDDQSRSDEELLDLWRGILDQATDASQIIWESRSPDQPVRWRMRELRTGQLHDHGTLAYPVARALIQRLWSTSIPDLDHLRTPDAVVLPTQQVMVPAATGETNYRGEPKAPDLYMVRGALIQAHPSGWDLLVTWAKPLGLLNGH